MTKKHALDHFELQLNNPLNKPIVTVPKIAKCFGNCPDMKIGDVVLYFCLSTTTIDDKLVNLKNSGNLLSFQKELDIRQNQTADRIVAITKEYLESEPEDFLQLTPVRGNDSYFPVFQQIVKI
jgi:hypothetical protein